MEHRAVELTTNASIVTAGTTIVVGGIGLADWALIIGIVATVVTIVINWYYRHKHLKLAQVRAKRGMVERRACERKEE